jgi:hypothetical protein
MEPLDYSFPTGLTVKELKTIIKDWPEVNRDGQPTGVWIETGEMLSSQVVIIVPLNKRIIEDGSYCADILFESKAFEEKFE